MGSYYLRQKKYDDAIQEFKEAIRLTEGDDRPRLELGLAYELKGDPQWAQVIFEQVLGKKSPDHRGPENTCRQPCDDGGSRCPTEALRRRHQELPGGPAPRPHLPEAHNNLAWLYATCEDQKFRDPKAALEHAKLAVDLTQWKEGDFIDTLAEAQFANGDYQQAVEIQKKALALEPDNKELQEHMARYRKAAGV